MLKSVLFALTMLVAVPSMACNLQNVGDLPAEAVQKLKVECENARLIAKQNEEANSTVAGKVTKAVGDVVNPTTVSSWGDALGNIGIQIGKAASAAGMAVNDFIQTPAGFLITFGVIWAVFGTQFIGFFLVLLSFYIFTKAIRFIRQNGTQEITVKKYIFGTLVSERTKHIPIYDAWNRMGDGQMFCTWCCFVLMVIPTVVFIAVTV